MNTNHIEGALQIAPPTPRQNPAGGTPPKKLRRPRSRRGASESLDPSRLLHLAPRREEYREVRGDGSR